MGMLDFGAIVIFKMQFWSWSLVPHIGRVFQTQLNTLYVFGARHTTLPFYPVVWRQEKVGWLHPNTTDVDIQEFGTEYRRRLLSCPQSSGTFTAMMTPMKKSVLRPLAFPFIQDPMQEFPTHFQEQGKFLTAVLCHSCSRYMKFPQKTFEKFQPLIHLIHTDHHAHRAWGERYSFCYVMFRISWHECPRLSWRLIIIWYLSFLVISLMQIKHPKTPSRQRWSSRSWEELLGR